MSWICPGTHQGKMAATDHSRSEAAKQRRQDQLQRWLGSETDRTGSEGRKTTGGSGTRRAKVQFAQGAVFMAACSSGDREEVAALLRQGADINHANVDGLTALHQVGCFNFVFDISRLCLFLLFFFFFFLSGVRLSLNLPRRWSVNEPHRNEAFRLFKSSGNVGCFLGRKKKE